MSRSKALIITEKPSVAKDLTAAIGGFRALDGGAYWESEAYVCTFAIGHIFELLAPEDIDPALKSWRLETLPILPQTFGLKPVKGHERRIDVIGGLLERADIVEVINACDAAREGELIFREIMQFFGARKPIRRLWLQSMTPEAIRSGFKQMRSGRELDGLAAAAACRSRSDWLIGMNATRAFSIRLRVASERDTTPWSVGRVQTPTLALLVRRELEILLHVPEGYFRVKARFEAADHEYDGVWFDPEFKKPSAEASHRKDDRLFDQAKAQEISKAIKHGVGRASETREAAPRQAPWLFNLTGLQKYMASRYKWSSRRTLDAAQRCYEQHKVLTYPRTSSHCLPSDYPGEVDRLIAGLSDHPLYGSHAQFLLANGRQNDQRVFNDKGVSDHFAIIPTGKQMPLAGDDARVYDAVVRRFLATFFPPAVFDRVKRVTVVAQHNFRTGPVETLMVPGWMAVYDRKAEPAHERDPSDVDVPSTQALPPLKKGEQSAKNVPVAVLSSAVEADETRPPNRLSEAQLLGLMEHAGRQVDNEELAAALMSAEGLGTAATRADIIQNLKGKRYVDDSLRPTAKGIELIKVLDRLAVARLTSAELTAQLELEMSEVEQGLRSQEQFMDEIARYTTDIVKAARSLDWQKVYPDHNPLGVCPACKQFLVYERVSAYACGNYRKSGVACTFSLPKEFSGRYIDRQTVQELLELGQSRQLEGFLDQSATMFKARLSLQAGTFELTCSGPDLDHEYAPAKSSRTRSATTANIQSQTRQQGQSQRTASTPPKGRHATNAPQRQAAASKYHSAKQSPSASPQAQSHQPPSTAKRGVNQASHQVLGSPKSAGIDTDAAPAVNAPQRKAAASKYESAEQTQTASPSVKSHQPLPNAKRSVNQALHPVPATLKTAWIDTEAATADFAAARGPAVAEADLEEGSREPQRNRQAIIGKCPIHRDTACMIVETRAAFCCETRLKELKEGVNRPQGFMVPKVLCRRTIHTTEVQALAIKGMTAELKGFISKSERPFAARLKLTPEGGFTFEFAKQSSFTARSRASEAKGEA